VYTEADCIDGVVHVLCAEFSRQQLTLGSNRLDELQAGYYIDPCHVGPIGFGSELDKKYKLYSLAAEVTKAGNQGKHVGDVLSRWNVLPQNERTLAPGVLRRESKGPASAVPTLTSSESLASIVGDIKDVLGSPTSEAVKRGVGKSAATPGRGGGAHNKAHDILPCRCCLHHTTAGAESLDVQVLRWHIPEARDDAPREDALAAGAVLDATLP
jgi:hypothetical protein